MFITLPHCKLPVCFPLFSSWWKEKEDYFDNKLEKYIFSGFCGNNYLTRYGKLNLSWACTAAWQASCWLPREFLRTVVLNPNCFHCSPQSYSSCLSSHRWPHLLLHRKDWPCRLPHSPFLRTAWRMALLPVPQRLSLKESHVSLSLA